MIKIHISANYIAHINNVGLIVASTRKAGGVCMRPDHPQYDDYITAIRTAIDTAEGDALCRALLN